MTQIINALKSFTPITSCSSQERFYSDVYRGISLSNAKVEKIPGKRTLSGVEPDRKAFFRKSRVTRKAECTQNAPEIRVFPWTNCTIYGAMAGFLPRTGISNPL